MRDIKVAYMGPSRLLSHRVETDRQYLGTALVSGWVDPCPIAIRMYRVFINFHLALT